MNNIHHPSEILHQEWVSVIRAEAPIAEQRGSLTSAQLALAYQMGWFKLFAPQADPEGGISLPEALRLEEALSWADGSMGWTVTLCSGAGWFGGFLDPDFAERIFSKPEVCLGGSGAATGTATKTENGYLITGRWKYATGADHLTHFTANCMIIADDTLLTENDEPLIRPFIFEKNEVQLVKDWKTIGLIATSSESFKADQLFVLPQRCFEIDSEARRHAHPIYKYPFLQFAETTLAVNISGMAVHFVDCCRNIFLKRMESKGLNPAQREHLQHILGDAERRLSNQRSEFYGLLEKSWQRISGNEVITDEALQQISLISRSLASVSHELVNKLYPFCGLQAADPSSEINRVWRDLHTASQHTLLASR